jgi:hypothetical protein
MQSLQLFDPAAPVLVPQRPVVSGTERERALIQKCASLLRQREFGLLDATLEEVHLTGRARSPVEIVGALRTAFPGRAHLYKWPPLLEFAGPELRQRGMDPETELMGLSSTELEAKPVSSRSLTAIHIASLLNDQRFAA